MPGSAEAGSSSANADAFPCGGAEQQHRSADDEHPGSDFMYSSFPTRKGSGNDQVIDDGVTATSLQYKTAASASSCGGARCAHATDAAP